MDRNRMERGMPYGCRGKIQKREGEEGGKKKRGKNGTINDSTGYAGQNRSSNETIFNRTIWTSDTGTNAR